MGTQLLQLRLHEAEAFEAKALQFQKLKALASASWFGKGFGFVILQVQKFTFGFLDSKLEKLNIFHFQIMFACIILPEFQ